MTAERVLSVEQYGQAGCLRYDFQHKQDARVTVFNTSWKLALRCRPSRISCMILLDLETLPGHYVFIVNLAILESNHCLFMPLIS
jgi:hypothetical protein